MLLLCALSASGPWNKKERGIGKAILLEGENVGGHQMSICYLNSFGDNME